MGARPYVALSSGGVVAETLLNHRLLAAMTPASSRSKSVINGREEYKVGLISIKIFETFEDL
ncbi:MAG: hypothetical protein WCJ40_04780 [Planctomycetota bacterium]